MIRARFSTGCAPDEDRRPLAHAAARRATLAAVVSQQMRRWTAAECFDAIMHDLRVLMRRAAERQAQPSHAVRDSIVHYAYR